MVLIGTVHDISSKIIHMFNCGAVITKAAAFWSSLIMNSVQVFWRHQNYLVLAGIYLNYEGDPRSNANPSVISFKFAIFKNGLSVYYDILSILLNPITFFNISHGNIR